MDVKSFVIAYGPFLLAYAGAAFVVAFEIWSLKWLRRKKSRARSSLVCRSIMQLALGIPITTFAAWLFVSSVQTLASPRCCGLEIGLVYLIAFPFFLITAPLGIGLIFCAVENLNSVKPLD